MKKILSIVALALFLGAGIIGCSSSSTTGSSGGGSPASPNKGATTPTKT